MKVPVELKALSLALISTSLFASERNYAEELVISRCEYAVESEGNKVGDLTLHYQIGDKTTEVSEHSHLYASGWWGKWELHSQRIERYSPSGKLQHADSKITEGEKAYWIQVEKDTDEYWATASKVEKLSQRETDELIELASTLSTSVVPNLAETLSLSSALLSDRSTNSQSLRLPANSFDTTLNHFPFWLAKFHSGSLPASVILLDLESLKTTRMAVTNHGQKSVNFQSYHGEARHLTLAPQEGEPLEIWLALGHYPSPCAIEFRSKDEDGAFVFRIKQRVFSSAQ